MNGSNAGAIEVGAVEVRVFELINRNAWRWSVCRSNAGAIEAVAIEVGVLGLTTGGGGGGMHDYFHSDVST